MRKFLSVQLCDDYEASQLNPVYADTPEGAAQHDAAVTEIKDMPEKDNMRARIAVFEAIIDTVVEDELKDATSPEDESPRTEDVAQTAEEITDKAVAMHLIPYNFKSRIPGIVARHLRRSDPRVQLLAKAAHFVMDAETAVPAAAETPGETIDTPETTKDNGQSGLDQEIKDSTNGDIENVGVEQSSQTESASAMRARRVAMAYNRLMEGEITEQEFKEEAEEAGANMNPSAAAPEADTVEEPSSTPVVEDSDVDVPADVPTQMSRALRYLASSSVNHRNATTLLSRKLSGPMLTEMLHMLRYHLPAKFIRKYDVK